MGVELIEYIVLDAWAMAWPEDCNLKITALARGAQVWPYRSRGLRAIPGLRVDANNWWNEALHGVIMYLRMNLRTTLVTEEN